MLKSDLNGRLCLTGPGTPAGEYLRRYWQPIAISQEVEAGAKPRQMRIMSEDLVLFRDEAGRPGLVGLHCSHRLTSLAYGRVEDGGIRCPFHGWLYDVDGHCIEQPAEPEGSTFKDRVTHPSYPCQELGGLIFTYMGPLEKQPLLPRYETLVRDDGTREASIYTINCNYVQNIEGADVTHFLYLHAEPWSVRKKLLASMPKTQILFEDADWGLWQTITMPQPRGGVRTHFAHFVMPASILRMDYHRSDQLVRFHSWYVPIDDTHTLRVQAAFAPLGEDGTPYIWPDGTNDGPPPGPENDYFRDYDHVDTISGIPGAAPGTSTKSYLCQDNMANETEGPIMDRSREHLGSSDRLIAAMRKQMLFGIADVENGREPKHILRDPAQNVMVRLPTGDESLVLA